MNRKFMKANAIVLIFVFLFSVVLIDGAALPVQAQTADTSLLSQVKQMVQSKGSWVVGNPKGVYQTTGTARFETWADGAERLVIRDAKGHFMSWGNPSVETAADGVTRLTVKSNAGELVGYKQVEPSFVDKAKTLVQQGTDLPQNNFKSGYDASKQLSPNLKTAAGQVVDATKAGVADYKGTLQKAVHVPESKFGAGYEAGKAAPAQAASAVKGGLSGLASKVKGLFTRSTPAPATTTATVKPEVAKPTTTTEATVAKPTTATNSSTSSSSSSSSAAVKPSAASSSSAATKPTTATTTSTSKISSFKKWATTPIEGGGKNSPNFEKGYEFGKETPTKAVGAIKTGVGKIAGKVKGTFQSKPTADTSTAASQTTKPVADSTASTTTKPTTSASSASSATKPTTTAPTSKLASVKKWATTPIEGGGKDSAAFKKGYDFGKDTPTKAVNGVKNGVSSVTDKVKGVFTKKPATTTTSSASQTTKPVADSSTSTTTKPTADTASSASSATKPTTAAPTSKLASVKKWATTPIEGGGKDSAAFKKGYDFGKDTPTKAVEGVKSGVSKVTGKVKSLFGKEPVEGSPSEVNSNQKTKVVKTDSTGKTEVDNATAEKNAKAPAKQTEEVAKKAEAVAKTEVAAQPGRMKTALDAGKSTLKAGFSPKSFLIAGGITVGFKIAEQVRNGEKISIGKAVGHLASGQFLGGYTGAVLGASAGSVVGSLLSGSIPVVGPVLGALAPALFGHVGGYLGAKMGDDLSTGQRPSLKDAIASMDKGAIFASSIGSVAGFALGNMLLPGIGGMVGGIVGSMVGSKILGLIRGRKDKQSVTSVVMAGPVSIANTTTTSAGSAAIVSQPTGITVGNSNLGGSAHDKLMAAYKRYSSFLSNGQGNSAGAIQALKEYKEALAAYKSKVMN